MERKIEKILLAWKEDINHKPLIVHGSRQVGKTFSILKFGRAYYKNLIYLNFESNRDLHSIFERSLSPSVILRELGVLSGETILENDSLIFFDEIQACGRALTSLKYFAEEAAGFHVIAAGSLLGIVINREKYSFPVGKVTMIRMYPLDYEEFLWALGKKDAGSMIRASFETNKPSPLHELFLDLYKTYLCIGGMPNAVKEFIQTNDYAFVVPIQRNITDSFIADMVKYTTPSEAVRILSIYQSLPSQLAKENKKFQYRLIRSGARSNQYETPMDWLKASGIVIICPKVSSGYLPLVATIEPSFFKVFMTDTGLLCSQFGITLASMLSEFAGFNEIKGALAENYVAAALVSNGHTIFYWESQGKAEVDFVIQDKNGNIIPIEVKSSENVRSKSLQQFIQKYSPAYSIRVSAKNFGFENNIKSVPLYSVFCI